MIQADNGAEARRAPVIHTHPRSPPMRPIQVAILVVAMLACVLPAAADELIDQINQAIALYEAGDFAGAAGELEFVAAQIRQLRAGGLTAARGEPLAGWTAEEATSASAGAAMFGGGTTAGREYEKGDADIDVQIVTDSPMLASLSMMLNNPMVLSASGQKLVRIEGNKASMEWEGDRGTINVVVMGVVLVTVNGNSCTEADLTRYAEAVNYGVIKELMSR